MLALQLLAEELHAPREQAESVTEAIIRHQDLGSEGKITVLGQVLQMATVFGRFRFFIFLPLLPLSCALRFTISESTFYFILIFCFLAL